MEEVTKDEYLAAVGKISSMSDGAAVKKSGLIMQLVREKIFSWFAGWRAFYSKCPPVPSFKAGDYNPRTNIGTMSTNGVAIFYDPRFVILSFELMKTQLRKKHGADYKPSFVDLAETPDERGPIDSLVFVMLHEMMHVAFKHHLRMPKYESIYLDKRKIHSLWNEAADYEINHYLERDSKSDFFIAPDGIINATKGHWMVPPNEQEFFQKSLAEKIFWRLVKNLEVKYEEEKEKVEGNKPQPQSKPEDQDPDEEDDDNTEDEEKSDYEKEYGEDDTDDEGGDEGDEDGEGDGEGDEDGEGDGEGGEGEGENGEESSSGEGEGDGEGGDPGGEGNGSSGSVNVGSIIYDKAARTYGRVTKNLGGSIEYDPISEEMAKKIIKSK